MPNKINPFLVSWQDKQVKKVIERKYKKMPENKDDNLEQKCMVCLLSNKALIYSDNYKFGSGDNIIGYICNDCLKLVFMVKDCASLLYNKLTTLELVDIARQVKAKMVEKSISQLSNKYVKSTIRKVVNSYR